MPSLTVSPTLTSTSATAPAAGDGTSIVALSDSSVISGSSALTASPGLTCTSMTGTSSKSPMSGTLTSVVVWVAAVMGRLSYARAGIGFVGVEAVLRDGLGRGAGRERCLRQPVR